MSEPLHTEVSARAAAQVRKAERWWGLNRPKAPGAIRAEFEHASSLIVLHEEANRAVEEHFVAEGLA